MKQAKIIIRPLSPKFTDIGFISSYQIEGKLRIWKEDDTIEDISLNDTPRSIKKVKFNNTKGNYMFNYPMPENQKEESDLNDYEIKMRELYKKFLCNHPGCYINGEAHLRSGTNPLFNIVDVGMELRQKYNNFECVLKAINMVYAMSEEQRQDVMYWFGVSPINKEKTEILLMLADLKDGYCVKDAKRFTESWATESKERQFIITIQKAIDKKIIEERQGTDGAKSFYIGNHWAGITFEDVKVFMKDNPKIYTEHVLRNLSNAPNEKTMIVATDVEMPFTIDKNQKIKPAPEWTKEKIESLRAEAKQLFEQGFLDGSVKRAVMSPENLLPHVENARKRREEEEKRMEAA